MPGTWILDAFRIPIEKSSGHAGHNKLRAVWRIGPSSLVGFLVAVSSNRHGLQDDGDLRQACGYEGLLQSLSMEHEQHGLSSDPLLKVFVFVV